MAIQFPSDTTQSPYEYNGVVYVWETDRWVVDSTGTAGKTFDLQTVTDEGNVTTNTIETAGYRIDQLRNITEA